MADITAQVSVTERSLITRIAEGIWTGMVFLAENNSRARALSSLAQTSDAELIRRGTTREAEARKIVSDLLYL